MDAGFPGMGIIPEQGTDEPSSRNSKAGQLFGIPTLEELIEACGEVFYRLELMSGDDCGNEKWKSVRGGHKGLQNLYEGIGSTPTEAVARLWLALNKK
jgi:hypothetical protein